MKWTQEEPDVLPVTIKEVWNQFAKENPRSLQNLCIWNDGEWTDESWNYIIDLKKKQADHLIYAFELESEILEIGCGDGEYSKYWQSKGFDVVPSDICGDFVKGLKNGIELDGDGTLPFEDNRFNRAVCLNVFQHVRPETIVKYLNEASRVLKPSGRFVYTYPVYSFMTVGFSAKGRWTMGEVGLHGFLTKIMPFVNLMQFNYKAGFRCIGIDHWCASKDSTHLLVTLEKMEEQK